MNLAENVKFFRERAGMTQDQLAEKVGKSQGTIYKIENGLTTRPRFIDKLAQALGVTPIELEYTTVSSAELGEVEVLSKVTTNHEETASIIPEQKHIAELDEEHPPTETHRRIKRFDVRLSAGNGNAEWVVREKDNDPLYFRKHWFVARHLDENNLRAMYVSGDSMEPYLYDKDTVIIDITETDISDGDVYAILFKGKFYVKELRNFEDGVKIISRNPKYEMMKATPENCKEATDFQVLGHVVWRGG